MVHAHRGRRGCRYHVPVGEHAQARRAGPVGPEEYSGLGLPTFDTALIPEEIAKACDVAAEATLGEIGVPTRVIAHDIRCYVLTL
jgi:alkylation response protein AidB-like acyl-CoA dehydrogenase